jgi:hypothetical protein
VGLLQQRYGLARDEIDRQIDDFERSNMATSGRSAR